MLTGQVTVLDTVKSWDNAEDGTNIVEGGMKITTAKVYYRVLENGRIEMKWKNPAGKSI